MEFISYLFDPGNSTVSDYGIIGILLPYLLLGLILYILIVSFIKLTGKQSDPIDDKMIIRSILDGSMRKKMRESNRNRDGEIIILTLIVVLPYILSNFYKIRSWYLNLSGKVNTPLSTDDEVKIVRYIITGLVILFFILVIAGAYIKVNITELTKDFN